MRDASREGVRRPPSHARVRVVGLEGQTARHATCFVLFLAQHIVACAFDESYHVDQHWLASGKHPVHSDVRCRVMRVGELLKRPGPPMASEGSTAEKVREIAVRMLRDR